MAIKGADKHRDRLRRMQRMTPQNVLASLYSLGQEIELEAEHSITEGSVSGAGHVASAPGEPPNADTRDLDSKIDTVVVASNPPTVHVTAWSDHAAPLEYGTSKMAPRPFMKPAADKVSPRVPRLIASNLRVTTRRVP